MQGYPYVAAVQHLDGYNTAKTYNFALYDDHMKEGDLALVKAGSGCYSVARVCSIVSSADYNGKAPTAEILCSVDLDAYNARLAARAERTRLKKKLDYLVKKTQNMAAYKAIADNDPEAAELLSSFLALPSV